MSRWVKVLSVWFTVIVLGLGLLGKVAAAPTDAAPLKALIVNGQNNHDWKTSSPILKKTLEQTGLFNVDVATSPPAGDNMSSFKPDFAAYNVVVLDYTGKPWPEQTKTAFVKYVKSGGGVVVYHAASSAFPEWREYNRIIGLGGWSGRDERSGPYIRWRDGKVIRDTSPGKAGEHGSQHQFQVVTRNTEHPIAKGLPQKWMHAKDELYAKLRGPAENLTILVTAYADPRQGGSGEHEPVLFTVNYGGGRVFHTVLGHVKRPPLPSVQCAGFIVTLQRGAEWAATGKVTQKVPGDFPTATQVRTWKGYKPPRQFDELLALTAKYEYGQSREPLSELTDLVRDSYDSTSRRKQIEKRFLDFLRSDATPTGKQFICRQLSIIGTEDAVPTLAAMLTEKATSQIEPSDSARYALERIPGPRADKALRDALDKTHGKVKLGIINSLGNRRDSKAAPALRSLIGDSDPTIAAAAVAALGQIADSAATAALAEAGEQTSGELRRLVLDAYLNCADQLVADGHKKRALAIYDQVYAQNEPSQIRVAALKGRISASRRKKARAIIAEAIRADDPRVQAAAIASSREVPGKRLTKQLAKALPELSPAAQIQLLSALADRGDRSALPAVLRATMSSEPGIRIAALKAAGALGDASTVNLLAQAAATASGAEQEAARQGLYRLRGSDVDQVIISRIPKADPKVKVELIQSVGERNAVAGIGTLLKTAKEPQEQVRLESLKVLKVVAGRENLPALIELLINAKSQTERTEAEKTIAAVARKIEDAGRRTESILAVLPAVKQTAPKCSLLNVLGRIGDDSALGALRKALAEQDAEVRAAAVRVLSSWPNPKPTVDLLRVAGTSNVTAHRVLAIRGYIRLIGLESDRLPEQTVRMYRSAMGLASGVDEKKMVLSGLANVKVYSALEMAAGYLEDDNLQEEAVSAVVKIAQATRDSHPQQTKAVLQKVVRISKNDSLRQQAERLINQIN